MASIPQGLPFFGKHLSTLSIAWRQTVVNLLGAARFRAGDIRPRTRHPERRGPLSSPRHSREAESKKAGRSTKEPAGPYGAGDGVDVSAWGSAGPPQTFRSRPEAFSRSMRRHSSAMKAPASVGVVPPRWMLETTVRLASGMPI